MPSYSKRSAEKLATCHETLQAVFARVLALGYDHVILEGHRTHERQEELLEQGRTRTSNSKHLESPSRAVDAAPYPIDWHDRERFHLFAGVVIGVGAELGATIRWGGDWDGDGQVRDNGFDDLVHFELV